MAQNCARPNCEEVINPFKAWGEVELDLERRPTTDGPHVVKKGNICAGCTNDLMDWWLAKK